MKLPVIQEKGLASLKVFRSERERDMVDGLIQNEVNTTCSKGCSACCYHPLHISVAEGILLYRHLRDKGLWTKLLEIDLQIHAQKTTGLAPEIWLMARIRCPLLKDNLCSAYEARPFVCRTTFSKGLPELCDVSTFSQDTPVIPRITELEDFHKRESSMVDAGKARKWLLPLSLAVLVGADIDKGKTELNQSAQKILEHYLKSTS